jgi:molecular chaperone GrpE (heat shock protein)
MSRTNLLPFDENAPVLRFEDSDDFNPQPIRSGNYAAAAQAPSMTISEDPFSELKEKQESLVRIRQELERTHRETQELEIRKQKEGRFANGRREVCEKLTRSLGRLERDLYNSQKAIEEISVARETLQHHLESLRAIQPEAWKRANLDEELDRAIVSVEDAENDFAKSSRRLASILPESNSSAALSSGGFAMPQDFMACLRLGFAFTLPLIATAIITVLLVKLLN